MPRPRFEPGYTRVSGPGIVARDSFGQDAEIILKVGAGTHQQPMICYSYDIYNCEWLTRERRPFLESQLRRLARSCGMTCVVVRSPPHNRMSQRDKTGELLTARSRYSGRIEPVMAPSEWHITIYMGQDPDHCQVQGHVFTYMAPNPTGKPPPEKVILIMDDPVNQRRDRQNIITELWICARVRITR